MRKVSRKWSWPIFLALLLSFALVAGCGGQTQAPASSQPAQTPAAASGSSAPAQEAPKADAAAGFYKGKTITWIVPYKAGGGYDAYSRMIAPFLEKYTGATVVIQNKPGAGGLVGVNNMVAAKPDGLTIAIVNVVGAIPGQLAKAEGMQFDLNKLVWLARIAGEPKVLVSSAKSSLKTLTDVINTKGELKWGATGPGSSEYLQGQVVQGALGLKFNVIAGFDGSVEIDAAMARGEIDISGGSIDSKVGPITNGDERALMVQSMKKNDLLPDAPTLADFEGQLPADAFKILKAYASLTETGRGIAAHPDTPPDRVAFLRQALAKALSDPELLAQAEKQKRPIGYVSGEEEAALIKEALDSPPALKQLIMESYKPE